MVEKPPRAEAPSTWRSSAATSTPDIFPILEATASDRTGEIQLATALLNDRPIYGCRVDGVGTYRQQTGIPSLKAVVYFARCSARICQPRSPIT